MHDPHIKRDRYAKIAGRADPAADLRLGVLHSPEPRLLDRFTADGYDLLLAGHTHGGQVCLPVLGTLVTNCDIDRRRARGLSRHPAGDRAGLAARVGRAGHLAVGAVQVLLPAGSYAAHAATADRLDFPAVAGVWRSLAARFVRDEEAAGSNPATPTKEVPGEKAVSEVRKRFLPSQVTNSFARHPGRTRWHAQPTAGVCHPFPAMPPGGIRLVIP